MTGIPLGADEPAHVHDAWQCPAHVEGCGCPDPGNSLCNPYRAAGHCPGDIDVMPA